MSNFDDFEIEMDKLSTFGLESRICNVCGIGEPTRSNLGLSISPTFIGRVHIYAEYGSVECNLSIIPVESKFSIKVDGVSVTGTRKKPYRR